MFTKLKSQFLNLLNFIWKTVWAVSVRIDWSRPTWSEWWPICATLPHRSRPTRTRTRTSRRTPLSSICSANATRASRWAGHACSSASSAGDGAHSSAATCSCRRSRRALTRATAQASNNYSSSSISTCSRSSPASSHLNICNRRYVRTKNDGNFLLLSLLLFRVLLYKIHCVQTRAFHIFTFSFLPITGRNTTTTTTTTITRKNTHTHLFRYFKSKIYIINKWHFRIIWTNKLNRK